jgi:hypothetical protein
MFWVFLTLKKVFILRGPPFLELGWVGFLRIKKDVRCNDV